MKILRHRQRHEVTEYRLVFEYPGERGAGFSFPCDEIGVVNEATLCEPAQENYRHCKTGVAWNGKALTQGRVIKYDGSWTEEAVGLCECGCEVELGQFTNACDCGRDYDRGGQLLAPRSQWGEETGESVADILAINGRTAEELLG